MPALVREIPVKTVLSKSNLPVCDYSANPYVGCSHACMYCYASFMKRFTGHTEDWGTFVDVKNWPAIKNTGKYDGAEIFLGSVTDPYQPEEKEYKRTRRLLEELLPCNVKLSLATKSDLVLRDLDLLKKFKGLRVSFSINTLDEGFRSAMDRGATIARRLEAMRILHSEGIRTTCFISPIFPGITDPCEIILAARERCNLVWLENLNLRGNFKTPVMRWIAGNRPDLVPLYERIYSKKDNSYWQELDGKMAQFCSEQNLEYLTNDDSFTRPFEAPPVVVNFFYHEKIKKSARNG